MVSESRALFTVKGLAYWDLFLHDGSVYSLLFSYLSKTGKLLFVVTDVCFKVMTFPLSIIGTTSDY